MTKQNHPLAKSLFKNGFRTPDTYVSRYFKPLIRGPTIYCFLNTNVDRLSDKIGEQKVLYFGQSTNLINRIRNHETGRKISDYFAVWFLPVRADELREIEKEYIKRYNPPWNIIHRIRGV